MIVARAIGIDLGTTNSAVAMLADNDTDLILVHDDQGRETTPSCVWCDPKSGAAVVGHLAYARRGTRNEPVSSIKRCMGTQMTVAFGGGRCTPAEISGHILRQLRQQIESELTRRAPAGVRFEVKKAIITVPAYFGLPAIEATREAGGAAGLEIIELLHEPTAAAIYSAWKHELGDGVYLVYDLGGGTFDVSVLRRAASEFMVLGISGDNFLGGDDFDRRLAEHLRQLLVADGYVLEFDLAANAEDRLRFSQLVALAERAKKALSGGDEHLIRDQGSFKDQSGVPVVIELLLTRSVFESLIDDLIERTLDRCREALALAHEKGGVTLGDVDHILLVGGSTRVPAVAQRVQRAFCAGKAANGPAARALAPRCDDPETAVALGAALRAAAHGIGLTDDAGRVRLWFRSFSATRRETATISGLVECLSAEVDLTGGHIELLDAEGHLLGDAALTPGAQFAFAAVELTAESVNHFGLRVVGAGGEVVALIGRQLSHSSRHHTGVGRTLSTAVLAQAIVLDATDGDRRVRHILLAEGTALPARATFTFHVSDTSGRIRLPICQQSRVIKELLAEVGPVESGTAVEVQIACDEQVRIEVLFSLGGQRFGGTIEPPPPDSMPAESTIGGLDKDFEAALSGLDASDVPRFAARHAALRRDLDDAQASADDPKVIQRAADLDGLVREARLAEPLRPPIAKVESTYAACLGMLGVAARQRKAALPPPLKTDLDAVIERARRCHGLRDRNGYADATQVLQTAMQYLAALANAPDVGDENLDPSVMAAMAVQEARQTALLLLASCLTRGAASQLALTRSLLAEVDELFDLIGADPERVLAGCRALANGARRIYREIGPQEVPDTQLEGLLRVKHGELPAAGAGLRSMFDTR